MLMLPEHSSAQGWLGAWQLDSINAVSAETLLAGLPSESVDAIITDPPYNMTELGFEQAIDWSVFWREARRVLKSKHSPVILFSQQPFTTDLIISNRKGFRNEIIWEKTMPVGYLNAKRRPLQAHENILVFADGQPGYTPQMEISHAPLKGRVRKQSSTHHYGKHDDKQDYMDNGTRYPRSVWRFAQRGTFDASDALHPTQKPLALLEKLLLTYTCSDWLVVDPFLGSGTTALAARNLNRRFIAGDISPEYCEIAERRLAQPYTPLLPAFA